MRLPTPLLRRPALLLSLPAIPLLFLVNGASRTSLPLPDYWTWTVAHSVLLILVPAAVAATGAALDASKIRRRREENSVNVRSAIAVTLEASWVSYVTGLLLQAIAIGIVAMEAPGGASEFPSGLLLALAAILFFHTAMGFLLGTLLRPVIAIPLALSASYSWLGFTGTVDWFPLRHLAGLVLETCCFYDEQPNQLSIAAAVTFSVGVGAAFFWVSGSHLNSIRHPDFRRFVAPTSLGLVGVVASLALAGSLSSTASEARNPGSVVCQREAVEICLYPEQLGDGSVFSTIEKLVLSLEDRGISVPTLVIASQDVATEESIGLRYIPGMTDLEIARSIASSFRGDQTLACAGEPPERTTRRQQASDAARVWLVIAMGDGTAASNGIPEGTPESDLYSALERLPESFQAGWINQTLTAMNSCEVLPPEFDQ